MSLTHVKIVRCYPVCNSIKSFKKEFRFKVCSHSLVYVGSSCRNAIPFTTIPRIFNACQFKYLQCCSKYPYLISPRDVFRESSHYILYSLEFETYLLFILKRVVYKITVAIMGISHANVAWLNVVLWALFQKFRLQIYFLRMKSEILFLWVMLS